MYFFIKIIIKETIYEIVPLNEDNIKITYNPDIFIPDKVFKIIYRVYL